ncbi:cyclic nucleotide-binding domain-containing protein [Rhizobium sp. SGZ-381]|uniref:cyclic nucleotide-binding domain-containing protein n=1 Tax=Rhizobium sp. SGZ-381 TaxID=3342800 RepID=UPI0036714CC0
MLLIDLTQNAAAQFTGMILTFVVMNWIVFHNRKVLLLLSRALLFVLLSTFLYAHDSTPFSPNAAGSMSVTMIALLAAKAAWWFVGSACLVGLVRIFLIFERKPREARLLQDLVVAVLYGGAFLAVISYVLSVPVGTLVATSGVFAIILGLALQSTLNDVFSGIALNLGRPYTVGDWIVVDDGAEGRVVETNWRATYLINGANDLVTIPNSSLAKARLVNRSGPDISHGASVKLRFAIMTTPVAVVEVMETALKGANAILQVPPPTVKICSLDTESIELELSFRIASLADGVRANNEIFDLAFRHAKAHGIRLADAAGSVRAPEPSSQGANPGTARRLVNALPLLGSLTEDEKEALSAAMTRRTFRKGDLIARQGEIMNTILILRSGVVSIDRDGTELMRLSPGDWFGEGGLLTETEEAGNITALTPLVAYEIDRDTIAALLKDRPAIADEVSAILSRRLSEEKRRLAPHDAAKPPLSLATRIRHIFNIEGF